MVNFQQDIERILSVRDMDSLIISDRGKRNLLRECMYKAVLLGLDYAQSSLDEVDAKTRDSNVLRLMMVKAKVNNIVDKILQEVKSNNSEQLSDTVVYPPEVQIVCPDCKRTIRIPQIQKLKFGGA